MLEFDIVNSVEVEVTTTRTIRVGSVYKINPSEAYLGVDSGNVRVLAILPHKPDNETVYAEGIDTEDVIRQVEEYKDIQLDMHDVGSTMYAEELARLDSQPFILYQYVYDKNNTEWCVFPLEEFVQHSMMY